MIHLLDLQGYPIFEQLKLEEALLRTDARNWCLINQGSPRSIVMGISGKPDELLDTARVNADQIPVIKRFSGGGTVIVDENTVFVTFICNKSLHDFPPFPEAIMKWSESIYREAFSHDQFRLRENDFVLADKKCGGNAQYIRKDRWLHHTSFLWNFSPDNMSYLLHPKKTPSYRNGRSHTDFLCTLHDHFSDRHALAAQIKQTLSNRYPIQEMSLAEASACLQKEFRQATHIFSC